MNMRIICYKPYNDYITHDFPKEELLDILKICEELGIKWYCIVYDSNPPLKKPYKPKGLYTQKKLKKVHKKVDPFQDLLYMYS